MHTKKTNRLIESPTSKTGGGPMVLAKPYSIGVTVVAVGDGQWHVCFTDERPNGDGGPLWEETLDIGKMDRRKSVAHQGVERYVQKRGEKGDYQKLSEAVEGVLEKVLERHRLGAAEPPAPEVAEGGVVDDEHEGGDAPGPPAHPVGASDAPVDTEDAGEAEDAENDEDARPPTDGTAFDPPVEVICGPRGGHGKRTVFARATPADAEPTEIGRDKFDTDDHALTRKFVVLAVGSFVNVVGGLAAEKLDAEAELLAKVRAAADDADSEELNAKAAGPSPSAAARLTDLVRGRVDAFRDPADDAYVVARRLNRDGTDGPRETMAVGGRAFRRLVRTIALEETGAGLSGEGLQGVVDTVDAVADLEGVVRPVYVRVAPAEVGGERAVVIDMGDERRRAIVVTRHGWNMTDDSPVAFLHPSGLLPLCEPAAAADADLQPYLDLLNLTGVGQVLVAGWLVSSLFPEGPYFVLYIFGDYGSAKTTLGEACKALIDPGAAPLRKPPKDEDALTIAAQNGHVLGFDNLSDLKRSMSDAIARVATGAADGKRRLYSDRDEVLMAFQRPQMLTSKVPVIREADLLDRALPVEATVFRKRTGGGRARSMRHWPRPGRPPSPRGSTASRRSCGPRPTGPRRPRSCPAWPTPPCGGVRRGGVGVPRPGRSWTRHGPPPATWTPTCSTDTRRSCGCWRSSTGRPRPGRPERLAGHAHEDVSARQPEVVSRRADRQLAQKREVVLRPVAGRHPPAGQDGGQGRPLPRQGAGHHPDPSPAEERRGLLIRGWHRQRRGRGGRSRPALLLHTPVSTRNAGGVCVDRVGATASPGCMSDAATHATHVPPPLAGGIRNVAGASTRKLRTGRSPDGSLSRDLPGAPRHSPACGVTGVYTDIPPPEAAGSRSPRVRQARRLPNLDAPLARDVPGRLHDLPPTRPAVARRCGTRRSPQATPRTRAAGVPGRPAARRSGPGRPATPPGARRGRSRRRRGDGPSQRARPGPRRATPSPTSSRPTTPATRPSAGTPNPAPAASGRPRTAAGGGRGGPAGS